MIFAISHRNLILAAAFGLCAAGLLARRIIRADWDWLDVAVEKYDPMIDTRTEWTA